MVAAAVVVASAGCDHIPGLGTKKSASAEARTTASATKEAPREFVVPEKPTAKDMSSFSFEPAPPPTSAGGFEADREFKPAPNPGPAREPGDYFGEGLKTVLDKVKALRGTDLRTLEANVYPRYVVVEMRDPKDAAAAVDVRLEAGVAKDAGKALLLGPMKNEAELAKRTFDLGAVPWAKLSQIIADAPGKAGFPGRAVSHVSVRKFLPFDKDVMIRIYLSAEGGAGAHVVYDLTGTYAETVK